MALRPKPYVLEGSEQAANIDEMLEILFADVSNNALFLDDFDFEEGDLLYFDGDELTNLAIGAANTVLRSNGSSPNWGQVVLTTDVTGILPVANGGTGIASYTTGDLLYASAPTTLSKLAASTSGYVLTAQGAGVAPVWAVAASGGITSLLTNGDPLAPELVFDSNGDVITTV